MLLEHAAHAQRRCATRDRAEPFPYALRTDHVDEPRLVFEVQEDRALRGRWLLAVRHDARDLDHRAIVDLAEIGRGYDALSTELGTHELRRMLADRKAHRPEIGVDGFHLGHAGKHRRAGAGHDTRQRLHDGAVVAYVRARGPERAGGPECSPS